VDHNLPEGLGRLIGGRHGGGGREVALAGAVHVGAGIAGTGGSLGRVVGHRARERTVSE